MGEVQGVEWISKGIWGFESINVLFVQLNGKYMALTLYLWFYLVNLQIYIYHTNHAISVGYLKYFI